MRNEVLGTREDRRERAAVGYTVELFVSFLRYLSTAIEERLLLLGVEMFEDLGGEEMCLGELLLDLESGKWRDTLGAGRILKTICV